MKFKRFLLLLDYIMLVLFPCIFYISETIALNQDYLFLLGGSLGIAAYSLFCLEFFIASRPKFIDKIFSLDKLYKFHMFIGFLATLFAYLHKIIKEYYFEESLKTSIGNIGFITFIFIIIFSLLFMSTNLFYKVNFIKLIRKTLNSKFKLKYETKVLLHNITLIGLCFIFIHVLMSGSVKYHPSFNFILICYFLIPLLFYFNHKIIKPYFDENMKYRVSSIVHDSEDVLTVKLKSIKGNHFNYLPGQFLYIKFYNVDIPDDEHPFTISSTPDKNDYISVTIKKIGDFTRSLDNLKIHNRAYIDGPFGSFSYLKHQNNKKLCFIAGGIGITPFLSMLKYMCNNDKDMEVVLFWGVNTKDELIFKEDFKDISSHIKHFKFIPVVANDINYSGEKGFVDKIKLQKYLDSNLDYDFYICGPPIMLEAQLKGLKELNIKNKNIHFEKFSL